jgi:hypothetical protein
MPKFIIEREMPGAGNLTEQEWQAAAKKSCDVLITMGPQIQWVHSYITGDKIYCIYNAPDEASIKQHAEMTGIPANLVSRISKVIDPITAEVS